MKVPSRNLLTGHWQLSTPSITAIGLLYVVGVGVLDIYCPPGMLLNLFYLLGIAYVAGRSGSRVATVTVSFAAVAVLTIQETVWSRQVVPPWVEVWNFSSRLVVFSAMGWLIVERTRLTRNLERLVDERTVQCKTEVEQHKNTSARLAEAIERFEQVVNNITEVFWLQDFPDYRLRYVSPGYERIWGRTCAEVYADSKSWLAAIHPDDREEIIRRYPREQAGGGYDVQYRILRPDGAVRWIRDSAFPVRNAQGEVYRITGIAQDI
ncbi:MAG: PAS domain-containing protein, partial [Verrucomicrobia bacterium]|nr:PAS domain-containing protein [Verrucomicrobiota bacterium]